MRYYGFGNYYLSSLQQGLQAHHVFAEMVVKYADLQFVSEAKMMLDWAKNHKTIVLLNGGNSADLAELHEFLIDPANPYPYAKFHEDDQSLNCALTSVGIILPEVIYDTAANDRRFGNKKWEIASSEDPMVVTYFPRPEFSEWQEKLIDRLNTYGLAK